LHLAAAAGETDVVKFLAEKWPEGTRVTDECQATPLSVMFGGGTFLVEQSSERISERDRSLNTPLHGAARAGQTDVVKFFVERHAIAFGGRTAEDGSSAVLGGTLVGGLGRTQQGWEDTVVGVSEGIMVQVVSTQ
jgi:hypothetical protein